MRHRAVLPLRCVAPARLWHVFPPVLVLPRLARPLAPPRSHVLTPPVSNRVRAGSARWSDGTRLGWEEAYRPASPRMGPGRPGMTTERPARVPYREVRPVFSTRAIPTSPSSGGRWKPPTDDLVFAETTLSVAEIGAAAAMLNADRVASAEEKRPKSKKGKKKTKKEQSVVRPIDGELGAEGVMAELTAAWGTAPPLLPVVSQLEPEPEYVPTTIPTSHPKGSRGRRSPDGRQTPKSPRKEPAEGSGESSPTRRADAPIAGFSGWEALDPWQSDEAAKPSGPSSGRPSSDHWAERYLREKRAKAGWTVEDSRPSTAPIPRVVSQHMEPIVRTTEQAKPKVTTPRSGSSRRARSPQRFAAVISLTRDGEKGEREEVIAVQRPQEKQRPTTGGPGGSVRVNQAPQPLQPQKRRPTTGSPVRGQMTRQQPQAQAPPVPPSRDLATTPVPGLQMEIGGTPLVTKHHGHTEAEVGGWHEQVQQRGSTNVTRRVKQSRGAVVMAAIDAAAAATGGQIKTIGGGAVPASIRTLEKRHHQLHPPMDHRLDPSQFSNPVEATQRQRPRSSMDSPRGAAAMFDTRAMMSSPKPMVGACGGFGAAWTSGPLARLA